MIASVLIDPTLPALKSSYLVEEVLEWMAECEISQLPVVDDERYLGLVSVGMMSDPAMSQLPISEIQYEHSQIFVYEDQHILELVSVAVKHELDVMPVLKKSGAYAGVIVVNELLAKYAEFMETGERGAIIVLKISPRDYSLSEISRIAESNGAKILMSHYTADYHYDNKGENYLTLKLNQVNVTHIVASFERFGYIISEVHANEPIASVDQERLDMLMRYLAT